MDKFVPDGFLTLQQSVERVGKTLLKNAWETSFSEAEIAELRRVTHVSVTWETLSTLTDADLDKLQQSAASTDSSRSVLKNFVAQAQKREEIIHSLRQALFEGKLAASILTTGGHLISVPNHVWGSTDGRRIFNTGGADFIKQVDFDPYGFEGRVLLGEQELDQWTRARMSESGGTVGAEQRCRRWLAELMRQGPQVKAKARYEEQAKMRFGVGKRAFGRAWENAKQESGRNDWGKPGRKS